MHSVQTVLAVEYTQETRRACLSLVENSLMFPVALPYTVDNLPPSGHYGLLSAHTDLMSYLDSDSKHSFMSGSPFV